VSAAALYGASFAITDPSGLPVAEACFIQSSACQVTASFSDASGNPFTPAALSYRVDDVTSGEPIVPWTPITPAASITVVVTSVQNALLSLTRLFEEHQLTLQITDGSGNLTYAPARWLLRRIFGPVPGDVAGGIWTAGSDVTADS